jgi:hypothetical protein
MGHYQVWLDGVLHIDRLRIVQCPWFAVLLTRIDAPDPGRDPHNHSRPFLSLILDGGYTERVFPHPEAIAREREGCSGWASAILTQGIECRHRRWSVHTMPQQRAHRITTVMPGTLTLVLAGRHRGTWHFWTDAGPVDWKDYGSEDGA